MNTTIAANLRRWAWLPGLAFTATATAAVYTVGPAGTPGNCTHTTIQAALNAAAVNPGPDDIRIANNQVWTSQALTINNHSVSLTGGFANCHPLAPTGQTRLSGAGGAGAPVLAITNHATGSHQVVLSRLEIVDGDAINGAEGDTDGGGVRWRGPGVLRLERTRIADNRAGFGGGGLYLDSQTSSFPLTLIIGAQVQIEDNQANSGGGIYLRNADLLLSGPDTTIRRNSAGFGGGISVFAEGRPQVLDIASGGFGSDGVIAANSSTNFGGGLNVSGTVELRLYTSDPLRPLRLERNSARYGGAIHASHGVRIGLWEAIVSDNIATVAGAALVLDGATLNAYRLPTAGVTPPPAAVACAASQICNRWQDNVARNTSNEPIGGAIARMGGSASAASATSELRMASAVIRGNLGSSLFTDFCQPGMPACNMSLYLTGSELVDNPAARFSAFGYGTGAYLDLCTVAGFSESPSPLFGMNNGVLSLSRSIVWQPGRALLDMPDVLNASFLLLHDTTGFPPDPHIRSGDPRFVYAAAGNWQLAADSPALDSAPEADAPVHDLARAARVVDLPQVTNLAGPLDLGAWERQLADRIFANGFEPPAGAMTRLD